MNALVNALEDVAEAIEATQEANELLLDAHDDDDVELTRMLGREAERAQRLARKRLARLRRMAEASVDVMDADEEAATIRALASHARLMEAQTAPPTPSERPSVGVGTS